jgi:hypothetical protein
MTKCFSFKCFRYYVPSNQSIAWTRSRLEDNRSGWFRHLFGFDENPDKTLNGSTVNMEWVRSNFRLEPIGSIDRSRNSYFGDGDGDDDDNDDTVNESPVPYPLSSADKTEMELVSNVNGARYHVGSFTTPSLRELREEYQHWKKLERCKLDNDSVMSGDCSDDKRATSTSIRHMAIRDIFALHTDPIYCDATFLVASQFNCLEFPTPHHVPENGITDYIYDPTQGPACAVAAAPGTVLRNYFVPVSVVGRSQSNKNNNDWNDKNKNKVFTTCTSKVANNTAVSGVGQSAKKSNQQSSTVVTARWIQYMEKNGYK